jgi:hypothetical protein
MSGTAAESCGIFTILRSRKENTDVGGHDSAPGGHRVAYRCIPRIPSDLYVYVGAWGSVVVKALRY